MALCESSFLVPAEVRGPEIPPEVAEEPGGGFIPRSVVPETLPLHRASAPRESAEIRKEGDILVHESLLYERYFHGHAETDKREEEFSLIFFITDKIQQSD